ncbi:MAG: ABC-type transport auxiliary lipoprotein family protein [Alkalilacustris sp.]
MTLTRHAPPLLFAAALALGGCAGLPGLGGGGALDTFELRAPASPPVASRSLARDVVVETPEAGPALDLDRIMIRPNPLQAQYLPGARWSGDAPVMMQRLMVRTLQDANAFRFVGRRPLGPGADFAIVSELTDFQAEDTAEGMIVRIRLVARLVREQDATVIASRSFTSAAPIASLDTLEVVQSFNAATDPLMRDFANWVLSTLGAAPRA